MTHLDDSTAALFSMVHRYVDNLPGWLCPTTKQASAKALAFDDLDSGYMVATAGSKAAGRGETIQLFHGSEVAQWPHAEDHMAGIGQAVPDAPGHRDHPRVNGQGLGQPVPPIGDARHSGDGDFELVFIPWFLQTEYRRPVPRAGSARRVSRSLSICTDSTTSSWPGAARRLSPTSRATRCGSVKSTRPLSRRPSRPRRARH